jgi:hypothetical protein
LLLARKVGGNSRILFPVFFPCYSPAGLPNLQQTSVNISSAPIDIRTWDLANTKKRQVLHCYLRNLMFCIILLMGGWVRFRAMVCTFFSSPPHQGRLCTPPPPASYSMCTGFFYLGIKRPGCEADHSHPSNAGVNSWSYTSTPSYIFMAWYLVKHRDNFTFNGRSMDMNIIFRWSIDVMYRPLVQFSPTRVYPKVPELSR